MILDEQVANLLADPPADTLTHHHNQQLCEITEHLATLRRAVQVAQWRELDEMTTRQASTRALDTTANWLHTHSELLLPDARALVKMSIRICAHPTVLTAFATGAISEREAKYVVDYLAHPPKEMYTHPGTGQRLPEKDRDTIRDEVRDFLLLATAARDMRTLRAEGDKLRDVLSREPHPGHDTDRNTLHITTISHGRVDLKGNLDTETGESLRRALEPFMAPRPEYDGTPDRRSPSQICAEAFSELLRRSHPGADGAAGTRIRPRICVYIPLDVLFGDIPTHARCIQMITDGRIQEYLDASTRGWTPRMGSIALAAAQRLACDCELTMIGTDLHGAPLTVDTATRFATDKHRIALEGRDHGCSFPGCDRPADWTQAHHIIAWETRHQTQIDGLCLLCTAHHVAVHHHGWDVAMGENRFPVFRPPATIDPLRRWRNSHSAHVHDPPSPHIFFTDAA